jgi:hypothetical protein
VQEVFAKSLESFEILPIDRLCYGSLVFYVSHFSAGLPLDVSKRGPLAWRGSSSPMKEVAGMQPGGAMRENLFRPGMEGSC